jgi:GNAT superfamily N-acetyltransferase
LTDLVFRPARESDLRAIVAMLADDHLGAAREAIAEPLPQSYRAAFAAIDEDPNQLLLVAEQAGVLVGSLQLFFLPGLSYQGAWRAQIEAVRIAAPLRGKGLGRRLIQHAIGLAKARGCHLMQLSTHKSRAAAHRFYEQLGFVKSHEGMKLALDQP